jgi:exosortase H (IPTLxxWG-CTERM-specific)
VVFAVSVLFFLWGYERVKMTKANDWYLFQVARSTSWFLNLVGHSSSLGDGDHMEGRAEQIRTEMRAWESGQEAPTVAAAPEISEALLSDWEAWEYKAARFRRTLAEARADYESMMSEGSVPSAEKAPKLAEAQKRLMEMEMRDIGPLVLFVLKPGPEVLLEEARTALEALQNVSEPTTVEHTARIETAQADVTRLEQESREAAQNRTEDSYGPRGMTFSFVVIPDCGAIPVMVIFVAAVLAFPATWKARVVGLAMGLPVLYVVNVFRLAFLACVGAWDRGREIFNFAHHYLWQGIYIVFVVAVWMAWVELFVKRRPQ